MTKWLDYLKIKSIKLESQTLGGNRRPWRIEGLDLANKGENHKRIKDKT